MSALSPDAGIVFIGDSVTDCGRTYPTVSEFGRGYAAMCIEALRQHCPSWRLYNRGVAGECIGQVYARWQRDCLDLLPSIVTILVGINDVDYSYRHENHPFDEAVLTGQLEEMYRTVKRTGAYLVVIEPYAFDGELYRDAFFPRLDSLQRITRSLAKQYADVYIKPQMTPQLTMDGLHPTEQGHRQLADQWLTAVKHLWE